MSLLSNLAEISAIILTFVFFCMIANTFFPKGKHYHFSGIVLFGIVELCLGLVPADLLPNIVFSLLTMLLSFFVLLLFFDGALWKKTMVLLLFNISDILITNLVTNLFLLSNAISQEMLYSSGSYIRLLYIFVTYILEFMIVFFIHKFHTRENYFNQKSFWISALFFLCDFVVVFLLHIILIHYAPNETYLGSICLLIAFCLLSTTLIGLYLLKILQQDQDEQLQNSLLKLQVKEQEHRIIENEKKYELDRIARHDMKHLLLNYRILLDEGKYKEVRNNISEYLNEPGLNADMRFTENRLLDSLLHSKYQTCLSQGIQFQHRIILNPLFENIDIMVLISNLLDNAIEASVKETASNRLIRFELIDSASLISIVIQNQISRSVLSANVDLTSDKPCQKEHGLGLKSVRMITEKHNGMMEIYEEQGMFCVHIILPSP